jgi:hypothetical protein
VANTVAYYDIAKITALKRFIGQAPQVSIFFFVTDEGAK